jgi:hypothetical protein
MLPSFIRNFPIVRVYSSRVKRDALDMQMWREKEELKGKQAEEKRLAFTKM